MTNIKKIQNSLPEYEIDAMLLTSAVNRLYATGFASSDGLLLVTAENAWFIIDSRYSEAAQIKVKDAVVMPMVGSERYNEKLKPLLEQNGIKKLGFEDTIISYAAYKKWAEILDVKLVPAHKLIDTLRNVKDCDELEKMIAAQRLAEKVFEEILPLISTDITEKELAAELIYRSVKNGALKESFAPIVVSGTNSSRPHGEPSDTGLQKGFLTIDFGVCLDGWCSDTTRTLCIGKPDDEMVNVYETVLRAQLAGIKAVRAGVCGADVDAAARCVISDAGYGEHFGHGFGHSLGLEVHEPLSASPRSKDILPEGAVISAEPGIYLPGRFGVRIEDTLYVTKDGCENITKLPKDLIVL